MASSLVSLAGALALSLVHVFAGKLRFLDVIPRSRWLSFAGGTSVAYVFLHLLPELHEAQLAWQEMRPGFLRFLEHHVYLIAMLGLATFYALERLAERARRHQREREGRDVPSRRVFWLHIGSFAAYNALIGYVLAERARDLAGFSVFVVAIGLHFFVNDYGLRAHHRERYGQWGRWLLSLGVLAGWAVGRIWRVEDVYLLVPLAFIGGGVILNVLKEELPAERESRVWAFALGLAVYSALLLSL